MRELDYSDLYEGFLYLDELREGGSVNMSEATAPLSHHLNTDKTTARTILHHWTSTFSFEEDLDSRVEKALYNQ